MQKLTFQNRQTRQKVTARFAAGISHEKAVQDFQELHGKEWGLVTTPHRKDDRIVGKKEMGS